MNKTEVVRRIAKTGIIPVVRASSLAEAEIIVRALVEGGIDVVEITMTVPGALRLIEQLVKHYSEQIVIGIGTVIDAETARLCTLAGAQFVVSPALNIKLIETCRRYSVTVISGALTPTEIVHAWQAGADAVKIFPCDAMGGAGYLKALKAPLPNIEMIPTGGVSLANAADFIRAGAMAIGVGGELVDRQAVLDNRPQIIADKARRFVEIIQHARSPDAATKPLIKHSFQT